MNCSYSQLTREVLQRLWLQTCEPSRPPVPAGWAECLRLVTHSLLLPLTLLPSRLSLGASDGNVRTSIQNNAAKRLWNGTFILQRRNLPHSIFFRYFTFTSFLVILIANIAIQLPLHSNYGWWIIRFWWSQPKFKFTILHGLINIGQQIKSFCLKSCSTWFISVMSINYF